MEIQNILVTGANGQLGHFIREVAEKYENVIGHYYFKEHDELDITNDESIEKAFDECRPNVVVNCAAYTNVNKAEEDSETAELVNKVGVIKLIKACKKYNSTLIQISTDYVFDGIDRSVPYTIYSDTNPLNVYGRTKASAEKAILKDKDLDCLIIRTSWLFSEYGKNFYTTMKKKILDGEECKVISNHYGVPTYAKDLAEFIVYIIEHHENERYDKYGRICHFTNSGVASWYDFALAIDRYLQIYDALVYRKAFREYRISSVSANEYGEMVQKPDFSVLDLSSLRKYDVWPPRHWEEALIDCISNDS